MAKLPIRIGSDLRERVENSYEEAIRQVGEAEELYVRSQPPKALAGLTTGSQDWRSDVALAAKPIFQAYQNADHARAEDANPRAVLLAALFHLRDPYDVIPDRVPGYIERFANSSGAWRDHFGLVQ